MLPFSKRTEETRPGVNEELREGKKSRGDAETESVDHKETDDQCDDDGPRPSSTELIRR